MKYPFEVMCVKLESRNAATKEPLKPILNVGSEYTAIGACEFRGRTYYELSGYPFHRFHAGLFAILPDTEPEEMNAQEKEAIVNLEKAVV